MSKRSKQNSQWAPFEAYNALEAPLRAEALVKLGMKVENREIHGILTKSHFVIPGHTSFECQRCGECCRYARKVAQLTYEPCPFLTPENTCAKHEEHYQVCEWFPFWVYNDPERGPMLTIKPYCTGYGKGPLVDYQPTLKRIQQLAASQAQQDDGAFIIHEVLHIPGRRDWAFPSKTNIDELIAYIRGEQSKAGGRPPPADRPVERTGEVHYAHHYTSGLLGASTAPFVTVNEKHEITDANEAACQLCGTERATLTGRSFPALFINPERVAASVQSCFAHGRETASPQRLRQGLGAAQPVMLNGLVYRDRADGLVHGILVALSPVTAAVYSELSQSRTYARALLEASLDAFMVIDKDGVITDVNEALVRFSGRERAALNGLAFRELFVDKARADEGVKLTFHHEKVRDFDLSLINTAGEVLPVSFNATVYRDSEGVVQGIFAAARDVREKLNMARELEEAKKRVKELETRA